MKITQDNTLFVMIDMQEKFRDAIFDLERIEKNINILNHASEALYIPLIYTEQNPKGLGETMLEIYRPKNAKKFEKTKFSIFTKEIEEAIKKFNIKNLVLFGIEAHVCISQSAMDAMEKGYNVFLVQDALSSRTEANKKIAINRMREKGSDVISTEMLLFEIIQNSKHPAFKKIASLIK